MESTSSQVSNEVNSGSQKSTIPSSGSSMQSQTFCPVCQFPLKTLKIATPSKHITKCKKRNAKPKRDCPNGIDCISTMESHYQIYSHKNLQEYRDDPERSLAPSNTSMSSIDRLFESLHGRTPKKEVKLEISANENHSPFIRPFIDLTDSPSSSEEFKNTQNSSKKSRKDLSSFFKNVTVSPLVSSNATNTVISQKSSILGKHKAKETEPFIISKPKKSKNITSEIQRVFSSQKVSASTQTTQKLKSSLNINNSLAIIQEKLKHTPRKNWNVKVKPPLGANPWTITASQVEKRRETKEIEIIDLTDDCGEETSQETISSLRRSPQKNSEQLTVDATPKKLRSSPFVQTSTFEKDKTLDGAILSKTWSSNIKAEPLTPSQQTRIGKKTLSQSQNNSKETFMSKMCRKYPVIKIERVSNKRPEQNPTNSDSSIYSGGKIKTNSDSEKFSFLPEEDQDIPIQSTQIPNSIKKSQTGFSSTLDTQDSEDWVIPLPRGPGFVPVSPIQFDKSGNFMPFISPTNLSKNMLSSAKSSQECSAEGKNPSIILDQNSNLFNMRRLDDKAGNSVAESNSSYGNSKNSAIKNKNDAVLEGKHSNKSYTAESSNPDNQNGTEFREQPLGGITSNLSNEGFVKNQCIIINSSLEDENSTSDAQNGEICDKKTADFPKKSSTFLGDNSGSDTKLDSNPDITTSKFLAGNNVENNSKCGNCSNEEDIMESSMLQGLSHCQTLPFLSPVSLKVKRLDEHIDLKGKNDIDSKSNNHCCRKNSDPGSGVKRYTSGSNNNEKTEDFNKTASQFSKSAKNITNFDVFDKPGTSYDTVDDGKPSHSSSANTEFSNKTSDCNDTIPGSLKKAKIKPQDVTNLNKYGTSCSNIDDDKPSTSGLSSFSNSSPKNKNNFPSNVNGLRKVKVTPIRASWSKIGPQSGSGLSTMDRRFDKGQLNGINKAPTFDGENQNGNQDTGNSENLKSSKKLLQKGDDTLSSSSKKFSLQNWLNSSKKSKKQGDIGSMMFGLKPKLQEIVKKENPNGSWKNGTKTGGNGFYRSNKTRKCPFYKIVSGTDIAVDAFSYGVVEGVQFYFLSHFHSDHYMGLTKKYWRHKVFCSQVTGNLVAQKIRLSEELIVRLPMGEEIEVGQVKVTLLEANHCPGAVLFLFKLRNNRVLLHTGDFRAQEEMEKYNALQGIRVDTLYLDTTYLNPEYRFPLQRDVIKTAVSIATTEIKECPKTLFVVGTYLIGKERIFAAVANAIGSQAFVAQDKFRTIQCLQDDTLSKLVTRDATEANVHVIPMRQLSVKDLKSRLCQFRQYEQLVAFKPTGWTHDNKHPGLNRIKPVVSGPVKIYGLPYSEHSSFEDLHRFVKFLRPTKIIPTVNVGRKEMREEMNYYLDKWKLGLDP
uniref:DNA cross-link repair 1A protein-like n=1 Tax=Styela clava TaxID=7725 RepID=UPI00193AD980|nr:DNA cross-link repair 1A protein-like [Styela clava]